MTASASSSSVNSSGLPMLTGWCSPDSASAMMPADQVVDVAERPRLAAVAEDRDRPVGQRLAQEGRDRAAVVRAHPRAVRVEDPHDRRVDALLAVVGHRQRLGVALGLVVDAARADRVDVAPVVLGLRVDLRVAVDLARRGEQEAGAVRLGQAERVVRAVRADLQRVQRQAQVVDRRRRRGEVVDEVDRLVDEVRLDDVALEEHELGHADVLDVAQRPRLEVVDADDAVAAAQELVAQVRPQEARATGHEAGGHGRRGYDVRRVACRSQRAAHRSARADQPSAASSTPFPPPCRPAGRGARRDLAARGACTRRGTLAARAALAAAALGLDELGHGRSSVFGLPNVRVADVR